MFMEGLVVFGFECMWSKPACVIIDFQPPLSSWLAMPF